MPRLAYPVRSTSIARSTVLSLAATAAGFTLGALSTSLVSPGDVSAAFTPPDWAAESIVAPPLRPTSGSVPKAATGGGMPVGEVIPQPRECDLTKGVSTECVWMD
jgi:hypothetical protein